jgi:hypothetical protein
MPPTLPPPNDPGQARCAQLLSEAHDLLRERLEASDFYRVSPQLRSYHDKVGQGPVHHLLCTHGSVSWNRWRGD